METKKVPNDVIESLQEEQAWCCQITKRGNAASAYVIKIQNGYIGETGNLENPHLNQVGRLSSAQHFSKDQAYRFKFNFLSSDENFGSQILPLSGAANARLSELVEAIEWIKKTDPTAGM